MLNSLDKKFTKMVRYAFTYNEFSVILILEIGAMVLKFLSNQPIV